MFVLSVDPALVAEGKDIFRYDTFGDESFWTDTLRMNEVIQSAVDPTTALSVGLKVDAEALPPEVVQVYPRWLDQPDQSRHDAGAARVGRGRRIGRHGRDRR